MIPGVWFDFGGGRKYLVPPLTLGALELYQQRLGQLATQSVTDPVAVATIIDAAHIAMRRNYPDLTREQVGELIDLGNMLDLYTVLMDVSGALRREQESGNRQAMGLVTGEGSSPQSAETPAGPGPTSERT